jgi:uncharacterized membrane protein YqjE
MQRITNIDRVDGVTRAPDGVVRPLEEPSIGELFRRLAADSSHLFQQQFELAKTEVKETGARLSQSATQVGIAIGVGLSGVMALTAFLIVALGDLINNYAVSALIIGTVLCLTAGVLLKRAVSLMRKPDVGLPDTKATLREDARWANQEIKAFKRELTA